MAEIKKLIENKILEFKVKHGLDHIADEHLITTIHLMNSHSLDLQAAQDRSSQGANDNGIDGWYFDDTSNELFIYQCKLSESKSIVCPGFSDLIRAAEWLIGLLENQEMKTAASNSCIFNLIPAFNSRKSSIKKITFALVAPISINDDDLDFDNCKSQLIKSNLNVWIKSQGGKLDLKVLEFNFDSGLPSTITTYDVDKIEGTTVSLRAGSQLDLAYVTLYSLVDLYRKRGNLLFEKNVRLYLNSKESKTRLEHPLEDTLTEICSGNRNSSIFPFFHVGVTITAKSFEKNQSGSLALEAPSIINGCQTVSVADSFLKKLQNKKDMEGVRRFKEIKVITKIVTGVTSEELREIANSNNRQNPIESWQLFCNEPIHIQIEEELKRVGVFYERQAGKFKSLAKSQTLPITYNNTNNHYISIQELGQIICLCRNELQLSAKPSEIFGKKKIHDQVFDDRVRDFPLDIIWACNAFKATKRGLKNYLENTESHANEYTTQTFSKPYVKQSVYYMSMVYLYQIKIDESKNFRFRLNKIAPPSLVDHSMAICRRIVSPFKNWHLKESKNNTLDVPSTKVDRFVRELLEDFKMNPEGPMPLTGRSHNWLEDDL